MPLGRAGVFVVLTSCVLFVPERNGGEVCHFSGEDTECGACLKAVCGPEIQAACGDSSARNAVIPVMEECAAKGTAACARIPESPVGECLATRCPTRCYERTGVSRTNCEEAFLGSGLACSCQYGGRTNDVACSAALYPRTHCCAQTGWPGSALECTCLATACFPMTNGCNCVLTDNLGSDTSDTCSDKYCCAVDDHCQCRNDRPCSGGEVRVERCDRSALACPKGQKEEASCAIRQ
jgi:hypothetical protein